MTSKLHIDIATACIAEFPNEACGFVDGSVVIPLVNHADDVEKSFVISGEDFLKYDPNTIYHSHPKGDYGFSEQDILVAANMGLTSYLYVVETDRIERYSSTTGVEVFEKILGS